MARCEDFPCCGHENGCCPDYDEETGKQLNMKCTCGATVPLGGSSLCNHCLNFHEDGFRFDDDFDGDESDFYDPDHYDY